MTGVAASEADEPFVRALRAFDEDAWSAPYDAHFAALYRYAHARTGSPDLAEDVVAQVFAEAVTSIQRYRPRKPILAWLYTIARNHSSKALRDARMRVPLDPDVAVAPGADQLDSVALADALRSLPSTQREVVTLRYVVGASTDEISRLLGKSPAAVYSLQARALDTLRRKLASAEDEMFSAPTNPALRRV